MKIQKIEDRIGDYEDWSPYKKERYVSDRAGKNCEISWYRVERQ